MEKYEKLELEIISFGAADIDTVLVSEPGGGIPTDWA